MLVHRYVAQPTLKYLELVRAASEVGEFTEVAGAFAYGTRGGASRLLGSLRDAVPSFDSTAVDKRWLLGIDWCRTEPETFNVLAAQPSSEVRVHEGSLVVERPGCTPQLPWHPKVLLLRGPDAIAVIAGSGNMSTNGLTRGHEVGGATIVVKAKTAVEREVRDSCLHLFDWFDQQWAPASEAATIEEHYAKRFLELARTSPPITDNDTLPMHVRRGLTAEALRRLRTSRHLWIDAGNLHANRGPGRAGNQLMLTPMTRVFFGFPAADLPRDTAIGTVAIRYQGDTQWDRPLRFSNNSMDVLTLPVPGNGGPAAYDQETLLFTRTVENGLTIFVLTLASKARRTAWIKRSTAVSASSFQMQGSPRKWGVLP